MSRTVTKQVPLIIKFDEDLQFGCYVESIRENTAPVRVNQVVPTTEYIYMNMKTTVAEVRQAFVKWMEKNPSPYSARQTVGSIEYKGGELSDEQIVASLAKENDRLQVSVTTLRAGCLIL